MKRTTLARMIGLCSLLSAGYAIADDEFVLLNTYDTGFSLRPHAAAYDPFRDSIWLHESFAPQFVEFSRSGATTGSAFAQPGTLGDDSDITIIEEAISINGTVVPAGTALFGTGDDFDGPGNAAHLYAIDPVSGSVLTEMDLPGTILGFDTRNNIVGIAHSSVTDTLFFTSYRSDGIMEFDPSTGTVINEFTLSPSGSSTFDVFYGDVEYNEADGNLYTVGVEPVIRVSTTTGDFVRDIDLAPLGVEGQLSGLGIDASRSEMWITSTNGNLYHLAIPSPGAFVIASCGLAIGIRRRR